MKTTALSILLVICGVAAFAQGPPRLLSKREAEVEDRNHICVRHTFKSFSARLKLYPFNQASQIQLVSFTGLERMSGDDSGYVNKGLPMMGDSICYSRLGEVKALSFLQVDTLTDILYNYGYGGSVRFGSMDMCYDPHNAILFIDKRGKVFAYVEICFMCERTRESSKQISLGEMCDQKIKMIKRFFKTAGIEYGVKTDPLTAQN
jgi:hypothetical protein